MPWLFFLLAGAMPVVAPAADPPRLTIGTIVWDRRRIFSEKEIEGADALNAFLRRSMNKLHVSTRRHVLHGELLFREGDPYDPELLAETERNLRALGFLNEVAVTATDTAADGRVGVLIGTRETWTLETSASYSLASGGSQRWSLQLSDDNFLGRGMTLGAGVGENEDSSFWNLWSRQRRVTAADLTVGLDYAKRRDGAIKHVAVGRPFYAQDDGWTLEVRAWDDSFDNRFYLSNAGPAGVDGGDPASLHTRIPVRDLGFEAAWQVRVTPKGLGRIWRLGVGLRVEDVVHDLGRGLFRLSDGRTADLAWLASDAPFAREQGTIVYPYLWVRTLGRHWIEARHMLQYGPVEDLLLSWDVDVKVGPVGGHTDALSGWSGDRLRLESIIGKWLPLAGGRALLVISSEAETGQRAVRNYRYDVATGWLYHRPASRGAAWLVRFFGEYAQGDNLLGSKALLLGLDRGLRTLEYDGMAGDRLMRWSAELGRATRWQPFGFFRLGVAAFYGGGGARWRDETRDAADVRHEAGVGLRFGPTRSARSSVARFDLVWNLDGGDPVLTAVTGGFF